MPNTTLAFLETKHEMDLARLDQACGAFFQACDAAGTRSEIESAVRNVDGALDRAAAKVDAALDPERSQRGQQVQRFAPASPLGTRRR